MDTKAVGDVIVRHTCDGRLTCPDKPPEKMMVRRNRQGGYYIRIWTRDWPVTRIEGTTTFICEFAGRTS